MNKLIHTIKSYENNPTNDIYIELERLKNRTEDILLYLKDDINKEENVFKIQELWDRIKLEKEILRTIIYTKSIVATKILDNLLINK